MVKYIFAVITLLSCSCLHKQEPSVSPPTSYKLLKLNYKNEPIRWYKFPVPLKFHKHFPLEQRMAIETEIDLLNKKMGTTIFEIHPDYQGEPDLSSHSKHNVLYWGKGSDLNLTPGDQARTALYWIDTSLQNFTMRFDDHMASIIDFPSLVRHELAHALGIQHQEDGLMTASLGIGETKEWGNVLVQFKIEMTSLGVFKENVAYLKE